MIPSSARISVSAIEYMYPPRTCRLVGLSAMRSGTNPQMMVAVARLSMDCSATFSRTIRRVRSARRSRVADPNGSRFWEQVAHNGSSDASQGI